MFDLADLYVFPLFLVFFRLGTAVMVFPGLSDPSINPRARILFAFTASLVIWPFVGPTLPDLPPDFLTFIALLFGEILLGYLMGISARLFINAMNVAGEMISFAAGFQAATMFDPNSASQSSAPTILLLLIAGMMVFAMNLHHMMLQGIVQSYTAFPPGKLPQVGDVTQAVIQIIQNLFMIGVQISAPVVVIGFLGYAIFGIYNRLIPQLHVFFVALPISIFVGVLVLGLTLGSMLTIFGPELRNHVNLFSIEVR